MLALYSLVEAVSDGKIAESEIIICDTASDGSERRVEIVVRNKVRALVMPQVE
jgi:hypothetical protein